MEKLAPVEAIKQKFNAFKLFTNKYFSCYNKKKYSKMIAYSRTIENLNASLDDLFLECMPLKGQIQTLNEYIDNDGEEFMRLKEWLPDEDILDIFVEYTKIRKKLTDTTEHILSDFGKTILENGNNTPKRIQRIIKNIPKTPYQIRNRVRYKENESFYS